MTAGTIVLVAAAGAVGAVVRGEVASRARTPLDGVLLTNTVGAFAFGLVSVLLTGATLRVVGGGLLGALTTFSTWMLLADTDGRPSGWTIGGALVVGVLAATAGRLLGGVL